MENRRWNHRFTKRETVLLVILLLVIVIGLYFGLVYYPIRTRTAEVEADRSELSIYRDGAEERKVVYDQMKEALQTINESGAPLTEMPLYNNNGQQEVLAACFTTVFAGIDVEITYATPELSDGIYARSVQFDFTVDEGNSGGMSVYEKTRSVLSNLLHTGFRCLMRTLDFTPQTGDLLGGAVDVQAVVIFYERA